MSRFVIATACLVLLTKAAPAGQPIYKSMVECGAIYAASAELIRTKPKKHALSNAANVWRAAAVSEVTAARMPDAPSYVATMHNEKLRQWRSKGSHAVFTQTYREWVDYCSSLAGAYGLDLRGS